MIVFVAEPFHDCRNQLAHVGVVPDKLFLLFSLSGYNLY
jgi:hypothetical protein